MPMTIAVLGPGGVGGLVAGALDHAGTPVTLVARESTAELIAARGLRVSSVRLGDFVAHPRAVARLEEPVEALVIATKATGLQEALERIAAPPALVVPLLNGLDHVAVLRERFGEQTVVAGTIRVEADRPESGTVVHTSPFLRIDMASSYPAARAGDGGAGGEARGGGDPRARGGVRAAGAVGQAGAPQRAGVHHQRV